MRRKKLPPKGWNKDRPFGLGGPLNSGHGDLAPARGPFPRGMRPPLSSSQSPLSSISACGENCARSLAPPLPTARSAAGAPFRSCPKRKRAVHGPKEKAAWARSGAVALRAHGGRRIGASADSGLPSGTLWPSARSVLPSRASTADFGGVVVALICFSFRCRWPVVDESYSMGQRNSPYARPGSA